MVSADAADGPQRPSANDPCFRQDSMLSQSHKHLYEVLRVDESATDDDIKRAYRRLALQYHPDKNSEPNAAEKFKEINHANTVLSNPTKRRVYDQYGNAGLKMFETLGEDHFATFLVNSRWFKWFFLCCGLMTCCFGCCCCGCLCCCQCCCNFCCGKYAPKREDFGDLNGFGEEPTSGGDAASSNLFTAEQPAPVVDQQPQPTPNKRQREPSPVAERPSVIAMPPPPSHTTSATATSPQLPLTEDESVKLTENATPLGQTYGSM